MVNKRERQIRNEAATTANRGSYQVREADIEVLEDLREATGLNMKDVDRLLGESNNWYSNHKRSGGTHKFSRPDYRRIRDMLEVEYLRNCVGFTRNEVSRGTNNSPGWYEEQLEEGFKIDAYNNVIVFLVTAAVLQTKYDVLGSETLDRVVDFGIVDEGFIRDLRNSVDIDYGQ